MNHGEKVNAVEQAGAGVGKNSGITEQAEAHGKYTVECYGPAEKDRGRYAFLREAIGEAEKAPFWRFLKKLRLPSLRKELNLIPIGLKWADTIDNLVTTGGKNDALDKYLAGSAYTAAWYMGLISSTSYTTGVAAGDTMAAHGGWAEDQNYSEATRPAAAWSAASAGSKAMSSARTFSINATTTIKGCFLASNSTKGGTTGILYSAGLFSGGDKAVANTDTLNVSYTASL